MGLRAYGHSGILTVDMGIPVYMVIKLNIKATDGMIFHYLNYLDINIKNYSFDRRLSPCTDACEGEMANLSKNEERVKRCWVILDF